MTPGNWPDRERAQPGLHVHQQAAHISISLYMGAGRLSWVRVFHSSDVQMLW